MKLEGERTLPGTPEQLWNLLLDPDVLVAAIPGCKKLEKVEEDHYKGVIAAKIGSIQGQYNTTFQIADKNPPENYTIHVQGQGPSGFVKGEVLMEMEPAGANETTMRYSGEANVGGRIAQVGQRMVGAAAAGLIDKGFSELRLKIEQELATQATPPPPESTGQDDADTNASETAAPAPGSQTTAPPPAPRAHMASDRPGGGLAHKIRSFFSAVGAFLRALLKSPT